MFVSKMLLILVILVILSTILLQACTPDATSVTNPSILAVTQPATSQSAPATPIETKSNEPIFKVSDITISPDVIHIGDNLTVQAKISSENNVAGVHIAVLKLDNKQIAEKRISITDNSSAQVKFSISVKDFKEHEISIDDKTAKFKAAGFDNVDAYIDNIYDIPRYIQTDSSYGGFLDKGAMYCGPVSVSNSLIWLSDNGFPNLAPHTDDRKKDQYDVAYLLGSHLYVDTAKNGTAVNYLCKGLKQYIEDKGYTYKRLDYQGNRHIDPEFNAGQFITDLESIKQNIKRNDSIWLEIGWYTYDNSTDKYQRIGGHFVTLVGYGFDGKSANPNYLVVHDPIPYPDIKLNEYILPVRINRGRLNSETNSSCNADGFYKMMGGMHIPHRADFGILDGVVVLEMNP